MQACDLEVIRDIPGFQVLMKVVLKNQIQRMVEQLAEYTGEESVILTASVSDGSLSHLGSESGKAFLETYDGIKPQFLGFCLKMHHQQQKTNKQEFEDSSPSDLRQKFGPGSTQHGTRPHKGYDSKSMRHDPYSVGQAKHPQYQSMIKQSNDLVVEQSKNNDSVASSIESSPLEKGMDDVFTKHIQQETMKLEMEAQSSGVEYASRLQEAIRIEMEAENETETSDEYSDATEDDHQSSHYSGQDGAGQFDTHGHKRVGTESAKVGSLGSDSRDSRLNESEVVYDLKGEAKPEVSSNTTTSSDKDTSYNTQDISERSIKEELPAYSEVEQDDNSANGNMPLSSGNSLHSSRNIDPSSGNIPSTTGNIPSNSGNIYSNSGNIQDSSGNIPPASGNMPGASGDWMMNLHEMIGSIAAASGATSLGDTARKSPSHHVPQHGSPGFLHPTKVTTPRQSEWSLIRPNPNRKLVVPRLGVPRLLPQSATIVMKEWLYKNVNFPYPSEEVKQDMSRQTGLSLLQINNWFTNARRRYIQPKLSSKALENLAKYSNNHQGTLNLKSDQLLPKTGKLPLGEWKTSPTHYEPMEASDLSIKKEIL